MINKEWDKNLDYISNKGFFKIAVQYAKKNIKDQKYAFSIEDESHLFTCFDNCPWDKVKLVVVADPPFRNKSFGGLSIGGNSLHPEVRANNVINLERVLTNSYGGGFEIKDKTMSSIARQGVLFLPTSHTSKFTHSNKRSKALKTMWEKFNIRVIDALARKKTGLTFLFLGPENSKFVYYMFGKGNSAYFAHADLNERAYEPTQAHVDSIGNAFKRAEAMNQEKFKW